MGAKIQVAEDTPNLGEFVCFVIQVDVSAPFCSESASRLSIYNGM
jgi:hypothetical protein